MSVVKRVFIAVPVAASLLLGGLTTAADEGGLEAAAYCRQEAADYGIQPEHVSEYIAGCIQAMGGNAYTEPDEVVMEDVGSPEMPGEVAIEDDVSPEARTGRESE